MTIQADLEHAHASMTQILDGLEASLVALHDAAVDGYPPKASGAGGGSPSSGQLVKDPTDPTDKGGHIQHWPGATSKEAQLQAKLDQALASSREGWNAAERERQRAAAEHRSNAALRGHLTRWRKRVANGVCPVAGCHRHFPNVQAHVATQHVDWLAEHPEVFEATS